MNLSSSAKVSELLVGTGLLSWILLGEGFLENILGGCVGGVVDVPTEHNQVASIKLPGSVAAVVVDGVVERCHRAAEGIVCEVNQCYCKEAKGRHVASVCCRREGAVRKSGRVTPS